MTRHSIKLNSILNAFRAVLTVLVPLITFPYTSRIFLAEGTGQINFANSVTQSLALLASLGIYTYGVREGAKVRNSREKLSQLTKELFLLNILSTLAAYILFFILIFNVVAMKKYYYMLLLHAINIGFTGLGVDWVYGVEEDYCYITVRQIFIQTAQIIMLFVFVHDISDIYIWVLITVICSSLSNVINILYSKKYIDLFPIKFKIRYAIPHLRPVLILFATQLASKAYSYIDSVLLGIQSTDYAVGLYSVATKINAILITGFAAMYPVFLPRIVEYLKLDQIDKYCRFIKQIFQMIVAITLPCVTGLFVLAGPITTVIAGEDFTRADSTMRILAPIVLISSLSVGVHNLVFVPRMRENYVFLCTVITAIINLILSAILIPRLSEKGAAWGSLIAEFFGLVLSLLLLKKEIIYRKKIIPDIMNYLVGSFFIGVWCIVVNKWFDSNLHIMGAAITGSMVIYAGWLCIRNDIFMNELGTLIIKIVWREGKRHK